MKTINNNIENLNLLNNQINELEPHVNSSNVSKKIKEGFNKIKMLSADILENMSLKIRGREKTNIDIKEIMANCSLMNRYGDFNNPFDLKEEDFKPPP